MRNAWKDWLIVLVIVVQSLAILDLLLERDYLKSALLQSLDLHEVADPSAEPPAYVVERYQEAIYQLQKERFRQNATLYIQEFGRKSGYGHNEVPAALIADAVLAAQDKYKMDPILALALLEQESGYHQFAVSRTGARGLAQLTRRTATKELGISWHEAFEVHTNVDAGIRYLSGLLERHRSVATALRRYNGNDDPYFVQRVMSRYVTIKREVERPEAVCSITL